MNGNMRNRIKQKSKPKRKLKSNLHKSHGDENHIWKDSSGNIIVNIDKCWKPGNYIGIIGRAI